MDVSGATTSADDNSSGEFLYEVPITNIKLEEHVPVDIAALEADNICVDGLSRTDYVTIVIDEAKMFEIDNARNIYDSNLKKNAIDLDVTRTNDKSLVQSEADIDVKEVKCLIDIEETQIQNVAVFNGNGPDSENDLEEVIQVLNTKDVENTEDIMNVDETIIQNVDSLDGNRTYSDVILLDGNKTDSESTIMLEDDEISTFTKPSKRLLNPFALVRNVGKDSDCSIVQSTVNKNKNYGHNEVYKDNPLLLELLEKCLDMENTDGMTRVINRTLLVIYKDVDEEYKKSEAFKKLLTRTIMQLDVQPARKFSLIKNLCNELKLHKAKKRVPFITLESKKDREQSTSSIPKKRRKEDVVIDLDDDTRSDVHHHQKQSEKLRKEIHPIGKEYPSIELDSDSSVNDNDVILLDSNNSNKENSRTSQDLTKKTVTKRKIKKGRKTNLSNPKNPKKLAIKKKKARLGTTKPTSTINKNYVSTSQNDISNNIDSISESNMLLEPRISVEAGMSEFNQEKIDYIESRIASLKKRLEALEEAEVTIDTYYSPYYVCEMLKTSILNLYKELCKITGTEFKKRHEVRLRVVPGHPEGPVRCLEKFLNDNIDADGNPPFPDMADVMQCVAVANHKYDMKWTQAQIVGEAHALFTQFGRKMQKRRQRREWKDLLSLVKQEIHDPADEDPALLARLEANTRLARKNEHDLLESTGPPKAYIWSDAEGGYIKHVSNSPFVNLEHGLTSQPDPELRLSQSGDSGEDTDVDTPDHGNGIRTDNPSEAGGTTVELDNIQNGIHVPDSGETAGGTISFGSTMTLCDGKIVIQPTIKYGTLKTTDDVTFYTSEFKSFILKNNDSLPNSVKRDSRYIDMKINYAHGKMTGPNDVAKAKETRPEVGNIDQGNTDASKIAKEILELVQSDACEPVSKDLTKDSNIINTPCVALPNFNPTVRLTNLDLRSVAKYSPTKIHERNVQSEITTSGFEIYTHTTKHQNIQPNGNTDREITTQTETADKEIKNEVEEEIVSTPANSTTNILENDFRKDIVANAVSTEDTLIDIDTKDNIVEEIVKREPLDIPRMLAELGEGCTATIFDIEDPFLVIEISDSSESEDENV